MTARRVLIAYGSAQGSTVEIAEWIGETLRGNIPPTRGVARIARRIRARGHMTFGGSIANNDGFMARSMAKKMERTDFRNVALVKAWANDLANALDAGDTRSESLVARGAIDQTALLRDPA